MTAVRHDPNSSPSLLTAFRAGIVGYLALGSGAAGRTLKQEAASVPLLIVGQQSQRCVRGSRRDGVARLADCNATAATELWVTTPGRELRLAQNKGRCLDVFDKRYVDQAVVGSFTCNGQPNQRWIARNRLGGYGLISPEAAPRFCLDAKRAERSAGTRLQLFRCHGRGNQQWQLNATTAAAPPCQARICAVTPLTPENDLPWGLVSLPDRTLLYTRRDVRNMVHFNPATGRKVSLGPFPNVETGPGDSGLLGIEIFPDFGEERFLYAMHTSPTDTRVVRLRLNEGPAYNVSSLQVLLAGIPRGSSNNGGRLRAGSDDMLFIGTGDAGGGFNAQNTTRLGGKVLRIHRNGTVPVDNPFGNPVWSYGHRNVQGLAIDSQGRLWGQDIGLRFDETNRLLRGGNYGWPDCEAGVSRGGRGCSTPGYLPPQAVYPTATGGCGSVAAVQDSLFVACLQGRRLYGFDITDTNQLAGRQAYLLGTRGRLRTAEPTPDGRGLYLTTSNQGDQDSLVDNSNETIYRVALGSV